MTTIGWDTVDPLDPGCPSIPRTQGLEALRVENGFLVAVLRQLVTHYDESGAMRNVYIHDATWCGDQNGTLRCRTYESQVPAAAERVRDRARAARWCGRAKRWRTSSGRRPVLIQLRQS